MLLHITIYILLLIIPCVCTIPASLYRVSRHKQHKKYTYIYHYWNTCLIFSFFFIVFIHTFGYNMGIDYPHYERFYEQILRGLKGDWDGIDIGYKTLNHIVAFFRLPNPSIFAVMSIFLFYSLYKFCQRYRYCLFIILPIWIMLLYGDSENLWRQYIGISFIYLATNCLNDKNHKGFYIYSLIGMTMHHSVIIATIIISCIALINRIKLKYLISAIVIVSIATIPLKGYIIQLGDFYETITGKSGYSADVLVTHMQTKETNLISILKYVYILFIPYIVLGYPLLQRYKYIKIVFYNAYLYFIAYGFTYGNESLMRIFLYQRAFVPILMGVVIYHYCIRPFKKGIKHNIFILIYCILSLILYAQMYLTHKVIIGETIRTFQFYWNAPHTIL